MERDRNKHLQLPTLPHSKAALSRDVADFHQLCSHCKHTKGTSSLLSRLVGSKSATSTAGCLPGARLAVTSAQATPKQMTAELLARGISARGIY